MEYHQALTNATQHYTKWIDGHNRSLLYHNKNKGISNAQKKYQLGAMPTNFHTLVLTLTDMYVRRCANWIFNRLHQHSMENFLLAVVVFHCLKEAQNEAVGNKLKESLKKSLGVPLTEKLNTINDQSAFVNAFLNNGPRKKLALVDIIYQDSVTEQEKKTDEVAEVKTTVVDQPKSQAPEKDEKEIKNENDLAKKQNTKKRLNFKLESIKKTLTRNKATQTTMKKGLVKLQVLAQKSKGIKAEAVTKLKKYKAQRALLQHALNNPQTAPAIARKLGLNSTWFFEKSPTESYPHYWAYILIKNILLQFMKPDSLTLSDKEIREKIEQIPHDKYGCSKEDFAKIKPFVIFSVVKLLAGCKESGSAKYNNSMTEVLFSGMDQDYATDREFKRQAKDNLNSSYNGIQDFIKRLFVKILDFFNKPQQQPAQSEYKLEELEHTSYLGYWEIILNPELSHCQSKITEQQTIIDEQQNDIELYENSILEAEAELEIIHEDQAHNTKQITSTQSKLDQLNGEVTALQHELGHPESKEELPITATATVVNDNIPPAPLPTINPVVLTQEAVSTDGVTVTGETQGIPLAPPLPTINPAVLTQKGVSPDSAPSTSCAPVTVIINKTKQSIPLAPPPPHDPVVTTPTAAALPALDKAKSSRASLFSQIRKSKIGSLNPVNTNNTAGKPHSKQLTIPQTTSATRRPPLIKLGNLSAALLNQIKQPKVALRKATENKPQPDRKPTGIFEGMKQKMANRRFAIAGSDGPGSDSEDENGWNLT